MTSMHSSEIVVVGGGPAGIAAACCAAEHGCRVLLVDSNPTLGGQIWRSGHTPHRSAAAEWIARFSRSGAACLSGCEVIGLDESRALRIARPTGQADTISFKRLVIATGARELFLPLPGWTLPGFFGAGGLQALVKGGLPVTGKRVVVAGSGPLLLAVADSLLRAGAQIPLIAEQACWTSVARFIAYLLRSDFSKFRQALKLRRSLGRTEYHSGCWLQAAGGNDRIEWVTVTNGKRKWDLPCDYVACGFGLIPNLELPLLMDCEATASRVCVGDYQQSSVPDVFCVGEAAGIGGVETALVEGQIAGLAAANQQPKARALFEARQRHRRFAARLEAAFRLRSELRRLAEPSTIVCRCEDVTFQQLTRFTNWREAKLQSRCGMGACQGRICGPGCELVFGWKVGSVRPPIFPCLLQQLSDSSVNSA